MQAAERYLLGDLSTLEADEFEQHFFECPQCSEELRMLSTLRENARAVFAERDLLPARPGWWADFVQSWLRPSGLIPATAGILIAIFAGYQSLVTVPALRSRANTIQAVSDFPLYAAARGDETAVTPSAAAPFYTVFMDRSWEGDYASYRASVTPEGGGSAISFPVQSPKPGNPIHILMPGGVLAEGRYVLTIFGNDSSGRDIEVARFPFHLKFQ